MARTARPDGPADRDPDPPRPPHLRQGPGEVARLPPRPARPSVRPPEGSRGAAPNLPTALDPKLIARDTLRRRTRPAWDNLDNFEDAALDWLAARRPRLGAAAATCSSGSAAGRAEPAEAGRRRPAPPNTPAVRRLPDPRPDDARPARRPAQAPARTCSTRPRSSRPTSPSSSPGPTTTGSATARPSRAYLDRLQAFAARLAPAHNALKAHVLYHRLVLDRAEGVYDKARFLAYLAAAAAAAVHGPAV